MTARAVPVPGASPGRGGSPGRLRGPGVTRAAYLYIAPFFIVFLAFSLYTWVRTAWVSLHNVRLSTYQSMEWIGLDNYSNLLHNKFYWNAFRNTISIGLLSTVPQLLMALGIAHLLNYRMRGRTFFRVAMLLPFATSLAAATVIFIELFSPDLGLINWFIHDVLHLPAPDWQNSKWPSQIAVSTIVTWRWTGYNALIYLAGMQAIDPALYEAAVTDGASRWQQLRYVTIPGLRATIVFTIVVSTIGATQLFGEPLLYGNGAAHRRHQGPVSDARPADVPAGLDQRASRARLGDGVDDVRDHRRRGGGEPRPGPQAHAPPGSRRGAVPGRPKLVTAP